MDPERIDALPHHDGSEAIATIGHSCCGKGGGWFVRVFRDHPPPTLLTPYVHLPLSDAVTTSPGLAMFVLECRYCYSSPLAIFPQLLQTRTQLRPFKPPIPPKGNTPSGQCVGRCNHFLPLGMGHTNIFGTFNGCPSLQKPHSSRAIARMCVPQIWHRHPLHP